MDLYEKPFKKFLLDFDGDRNLFKSNSDGFAKSAHALQMPFLQKQESSEFNVLWAPAFAGVTRILTFYEAIKFLFRTEILARDLLS